MSRRWVVEWRVTVRSRLEGLREVTLTRFANTAEGAKTAACQALVEAVDGEVRITIESVVRSLRRSALVADEHSIAEWAANQTILPARFWRSRWLERDRVTHARTLVSQDFQDAARRCVHARLLDDEAAAALLDVIDAALDAHAGS